MDSSHPVPSACRNQRKRTGVILTECKPAEMCRRREDVGRMRNRTPCLPFLDLPQIDTDSSLHAGGRGFESRRLHHAASGAGFRIFTASKICRKSRGSPPSRGCRCIFADQACGGMHRGHAWHLCVVAAAADRRDPSRDVSCRASVLCRTARSQPEPPAPSLSDAQDVFPMVRRSASAQGDSAVWVHDARTQDASGSAYRGRVARGLGRLLRHPGSHSQQGAAPRHGGFLSARQRGAALAHRGLAAQRTEACSCGVGKVGRTE
jgi:hypothetical protein